MGPASKQDQTIVLNHQAGTGFRTGIGSCGERPLPRPGGQIELPEVIEGGAGAGAASEDKHGGGGGMVDGTVGISFTDGVDRVLGGQVGPEHRAGHQLVMEMLSPQSDHSPAATVPADTDGSTALQVGVGRYQDQDVLQDLVR